MAHFTTRSMAYHGKLSSFACHSTSFGHKTYICVHVHVITFQVQWWMFPRKILILFVFGLLYICKVQIQRTQFASLDQNHISMGGKQRVTFDEYVLVSASFAFCIA